MVDEPIAALIERSGANPGRRHPLALGVWTLGRTSEADVILDHADVSRRHARLEVDDQGATIEDLGSKNGTRIAGQRIDKARLDHGAQVKFGDLVIELDHGGARLDRLLSDHLELTVTRPRASATPEPATAPRRPSLLAPLLVAGVFAALLIALLLDG
ncbi:FHA domain-containing protein [Nannocystaceae bacterium ST9]